jgi:hypothetical protein
VRPRRGCDWPLPVWFGFGADCITAAAELPALANATLAEPPTSRML